MARHPWHVTGPILAIIVAIVLIVGGAALALLLQRGLSSRQEPTLTEEAIARAVRHFATPASMRHARNPIPLSSDVLAEARAHWADHCATCHGNDGSGQTEIGRNLYPKAPDMRRALTQDLTDGELFSIIRNGIRFTGMPAWGDPAGHDDQDNWKLVHFIRHLPNITPQELEEMKAMNPVNPMELKEEKEEENFLERGGSPPHQHH
jgi:mono/diheme cytochrome c family protein